MLIVQVCHFDDNGDAHYRLHEPSRHLGRLPGVTAIDCHFAHRFLPDLAERADVLVLQFVNDWELMSLCAREKEFLTEHRHPKLLRVVSERIEQLAAEMGFSERLIQRREFRAEKIGDHISMIITD